VRYVRATFLLVNAIVCSVLLAPSPFRVMAVPVRASIEASPALYPVPRLIGRHVGSHVAHFHVRVVAYWPTMDRRREGHVYWQSPKAGRMRAEGSTIRVRKFKWYSVPGYLHWRLHYECRKQHVPAYWADRFMCIGHGESGWRLGADNGIYHGWLQIDGSNPALAHQANWSCRYAIRAAKQGEWKVDQQWQCSHHRCPGCRRYW
jgi:hypothetical protein